MSCRHFRNAAKKRFRFLYAVADNLISDDHAVEPLALDQRDAIVTDADRFEGESESGSHGSLLSVGLGVLAFPCLIYRRCRAERKALVTIRDRAEQNVNKA